MIVTMEIKIYLEMTARLILQCHHTVVSMIPMNSSPTKCVARVEEVSGKVKYGQLSDIL